jgi:hypothetical protein
VEYWLEVITDKPWEVPVLKNVFQGLATTQNITISHQLDLHLTREADAEIGPERSWWTTILSL